MTDERWRELQSTERRWTQREESERTVELDRARTSEGEQAETIRRLADCLERAWLAVAGRPDLFEPICDALTRAGRVLK